MDNAFEQTIRDRAYAIWLAAGMEGDAEHHWLDAERAILTEASKPPKPVETTKSASAKPKAVATKKPTAKAAGAKPVGKPSTMRAAKSRGQSVGAQA